MSKFAVDPAFSEAAAWDLFDANVRLGPSGVHGELALDSTGLLEEMDGFYIRSALVSHWTGEEYDAAAGNEALAGDLDPRLTPAWAALPEAGFLRSLEVRRPLAVRLTPGPEQHSFSLSEWCSGTLLELLQARSVVTLIARSDVDWDSLAAILQSFPKLAIVLLDAGYRADRYLFPLLLRFPQLHFDSATYVGHRQLEAFVERFGADRILFGSRLPLHTPAAALGVLASARLPEAARRAIGGGNLRRLLSRARGAWTRAGP